MDCVFCKIISGEVKTDKVLETDDVIVFPDINPGAPTHLLIVPKKHIKNLAQADDAIWNSIKKVALRLQKERNLDGFRLVHNTGTAALISHMHVHFMAGISKERKL